MDKKPLIISSVVLLLALGGAAGWFFYTGDLMRWIGMDAAKASLPADGTAQGSDGEQVAVPQALGEPRYLDLDPPFLVNFEMDGQLRYLQVTM